MKKILLIAFLISTVTSIAQNIIEYNGEKINALDENNNQTGIWKLFDEEKKILIICEFKNGEYVSNTNFFKDSKLIASYNNVDKLEIYTDSKTVTCNFHKKEDNSTTLIDKNGNEIDTELKKYYFLSAGEVMPMFYGGINKLYEFIGNNFNSNGNKGRVVVEFKIDSKGFATEIQIKTTTNEKLNEEAIRIISVMPRCQPAYQRGMFVKYHYLVPINIK